MAGKDWYQGRFYNTVSLKKTRKWSIRMVMKKSIFKVEHICLEVLFPQCWSHSTHLSLHVLFSMYKTEDPLS